MRVFAALLIVVFVTRLVWGWQFGRRLDALHESAKSRGLTFFAEEVALPNVGPESNAWERYRQAMGAVKNGVDTFRTSNLDGTSYPPYGPKWLKLAEGSEFVHSSVFAHARAARSLPLSRIRDKIEPDFRKQGFVAPLNEARHLANVLADGAQYQEVRGNSREAVERLRDLLAFSRAIGQDPQMVSALVASGIVSLACESAQIVAPGLRLSADDPDAGPTRAAVRGLIADLLSERHVREMRAALAGDRIPVTYMFRTQGQQRWFIRPLADRSEFVVGSNFDLAIDGAAAASWPEAQLIISRRRDESNAFAVPFASQPPDEPRYSRWFHFDAPYVGKFVERGMQVAAERRAIAVILAAQLYRADHRCWPERLELLVPNYLSMVPRDPFSAQTPPLGYVILRKSLPDGGDRPLVYFEPAPVDGQDAEHWRTPRHGWQQGTVNGRSVPSIRQYRDLARFRPADVKIVENGEIMPMLGGGYGDAGIYRPAPSSQRVDDDPEKPDAPRQDEPKQPKAD